MVENNSIAIVIPSYKVSSHIAQVIATLPASIDHIIVVDDMCPEKSGMIAQQIAVNDPRIQVIFHEKNQGVGGAVISGYYAAMDKNCDIVIKMDGDGQMDPGFIPALIEPLKKNKADYTKGCRFSNPETLRNMPKIRLFGNSMLSFILKVCSGYWNVMDPTNGYTAISIRALKKLRFEHLSKRYFFESDMLVHLNIYNCVVRDIAMPSIYGDEKSSLRVGNILLKFPFLLTKRFFKRIFYKFFLFDFNMASVYIITGLPMFIFGTLFGIYRWIYGSMHQEINSTGTIMLSILPIILGIQFILQAIQIDISSIPKKMDDEE
ncbi:MAG: glycosyl transferase family 2 [Bacteroidetes bacterium GWF2_43_63]|nr:MAG: glycosyl transferase family 2 [Bacteroidetes bacterium GWE2_42_42]OFY56029.1 MAG: glycosyl transferase family 2 [Bacteroidetes bacterium GWF2_43_63]HBG70726.1 glycosyl transferase family 2 [Bacteroidales bacterium]HCB62446.1 glycosyl transferase family 2 [Bacteroidales bacterium]HCY21901.1 glycosyl transferase family 2 [Bacteroidales bacterium]